MSSDDILVVRRRLIANILHKNSSGDIHENKKILDDIEKAGGVLTEDNGKHIIDSLTYLRKDPVPVEMQNNREASIKAIRKAIKKKSNPSKEKPLVESENFSLWLTEIITKDFHMACSVTRRTSNGKGEEVGKLYGYYEGDVSFIPTDSIHLSPEELIEIGEKMGHHIYKLINGKKGD